MDVSFLGHAPQKSKIYYTMKQLGCKDNFLSFLEKNFIMGGVNPWDNDFLAVLR